MDNKDCNDHGLERLHSSHKQGFIRFYDRWYFLVIFLLLTTIVSACSDNSSSLFRFKAYRFPAKSMVPTLLPGERILVDRQYYEDHKPARGEIIVFDSLKDPKKTWLKRIIAIEKDVVKGEKRKVYLNGKVLKEPYVQHTSNESIEVMDNFGPITVPEGTLFVMGDNRDESLDSRHFGVVPVEKVKGKVGYIYWSKELGRIGTEVH
jgi:signal peptidase I